MKFETRSYSHAVGEFNYHIQLTVAYRRKIFSKENVLKLTEAYLREKLREIKVEVVSLEFGPEHVHIFVTNCKNYAPCKIVQLIKGFSSRMMRKNHLVLFRDFLWGKKFWTEGYFARSIGCVTTERVRYYIEESQSKHWEDLSRSGL